MKKINKRLCSLLLAAVMVVLAIPTTPVFAANGTTGWGATWVSKTVTKDNGGTGSISAGEGFTIIGVSGNRLHINYSTSSGPAQGWISTGSMTIDTSTAYAATAISNATVYAGTNTGTYVLGSISSGEVVAVFGRQGNYFYIEYNVNNQSYVRKRGWVYVTSLDFSLSGNQSPNSGSFYTVTIPRGDLQGRSLFYAPGAYTPWTNVTSNAVVVRSITTIHGQEYGYVEYENSSGVLMSGYVIL